MTNERLDQTNERLDQTNERLGRLDQRFDSLLEFSGDRYRDHERRIAAVEHAINELQNR